MSGRLMLMVGNQAFAARLEMGAPQSAGWLRRTLPFHGTVLHARWSGEATWVRLGDTFSLPHENATAHPAPGAVLLYPGGISEPELLIPYGPCAFASRAGVLAGNHFATILADADALRAVCEATLLHGAQPFQMYWE